MTNAMGPPPSRNPNSVTNPEIRPSDELASSSGAAEIASANLIKSAMGPPPPSKNSTNLEIKPVDELASSSGASEIASATPMKSAMGPPLPRNPITPKPDTIESNMDTAQGQPHSDTTEPVEKNPESSSPEVSAKPPTQKQSQSVGVPYKIPAWSGAPCHQFYLEVLKDGSIIDQFNVYEKGAYMFGRLDLCDFVLEHPTISRFHAVIQFKRSGHAYLYDLGSTHGTFLNKNEVEKNTYIDLHVGDVIRFGRSSRLFIFQGPSELMLPETDKKIMREVKMREQMLDREASLQRARLEASLADGISWGMGEDAIEEAEDDADEITWQSYKGQLTEKQEKTREKIIKRMEKISNMKKEINAIRVKDISQGGLTQGQQTQIARNEQRITQVMEELENLEETLNDSIRESIGGRSGKISRGKKKDATEDEEEYQSDDDEFYDRTKKKPSHLKDGDNQSIETADTLLDKKEAIIKEMNDKKELLLIEKNKIPSESDSKDVVGDALDAYMSGLSSQLVYDKTVQLEKDLSTLQSELDRICYLLKIADPAGEAAKKRELQAREPKPNKTEEAASIVKKKPPSESQKNSEPCSKADKKKPPAETQKNIEPFAKADGSKEGVKTTDAALIMDKSAADSNTQVAENVVYSVPKPQWLGAVGDKVTNDTQQIAETTDQNEMDESNQFIDYKDRDKISRTGGNAEVMMESGIESAAPGLIIRKRKQVDRTGVNDHDTSKLLASSSTGAELVAEDAVALLLKHKKGYYANDEEGGQENQDTSETNDSGRQTRKTNRVLGPDKPSFLGGDTDMDYESWVPPKGQSGDGRTSLNERYGY